MKSNDKKCKKYHWCQFCCYIWWK